jgi:hypothetical protein
VIGFWVSHPANTLAGIGTLVIKRKNLIWPVSCVSAGKERCSAKGHPQPLCAGEDGLLWCVGRIALSIDEFTAVGALTIHREKVLQSSLAWSRIEPLLRNKAMRVVTSGNPHLVTNP